MFYRLSYNHRIIISFDLFMEALELDTVKSLEMLRGLQIDHSLLK